MFHLISTRLIDMVAYFFLSSFAPSSFIRFQTFTTYKIYLDHYTRNHTTLFRLRPAYNIVMATISGDRDGGRRPSSYFFDLPREIRDQIYGYLIKDTHNIVPTLGPGHRYQGDDFRHLPILRVSKRVNWEAMQSLQRRSWFIYRMPDSRFYRRLYDNTITRYMMNVQIIINRDTLKQDLASIFCGFAGTKIERQTFVVLIPVYSLIVMKPLDYYTLWDDFRKHLQLIKLLTGFKTVVVQANLKPYKHLRRAKIASDEYCTKLLTDILEFSEPELGPFVPCDSEREEGYGLNFKFSPLRFTAEQQRLAAEQQRLAAERSPSITVEN